MSSFPSFSTNDYKEFVPTPTLKVAADIIIYGTPNKTDLSTSLLKKLDQSADQLLDGSLMAIEAATEMITESLDMSRDAYSKVDRNSPDLKELLTVQCHNSLFESYTSILSGGNKIDLIKIPKDDVFYAWIEKFREAPCGTISMTVCTLSFPTYSNILRKLVENKKTSQEFLENMKYNANKLEKEEIKEAFEKLDDSMYDPRKFVESNDIVVSNFVFKHRQEKDNSWLIDNISMQTGKRALSKVAEFRWRGRMLLSLRGWSIKKIVRYDYITDYFMMLMLFYGAIIVSKTYGS